MPDLQDLPDEVEQCARSIKEDDPSMDKESAIAICQDMNNRGVLTDYLEADPSHELVALAEFRNPGDIQRVEQDGGVLYKRVMLLSPGVWTDAGSRETIEYAGEAIRESADQWADHQINLLHGPALHNAEVMGQIGEIQPETIVVDDQDRLYADLFLNGNTPASELGIELLDEVLEAAQDPARETPPVGPSVEISDDVVEFDDERGLQVMQEMTFAGLGIVFNPASRPVEMESQVRERAVAMSDVESNDFAVIRSLEEDSGGNLKSESRHTGYMSDSERQEVSQLLKDIGESIDEVRKTLQSDDEMGLVMELVEEYEADGNDLDDPASDFVAWVEQETDFEQADVGSVLNAYVEAVEADSLDETPVSGLMEWINEQSAESEETEEEGGEENSGHDDEDGTMSQDELQEAKQTIAEFSSHLEDVKDMLTEHREEIEEDLEDLERRLQDIEDEPQKKSLTRPNDEPFIDKEEDEDASEHEEVML
jgi:gas vesicle protein